MAESLVTHDPERGLSYIYLVGKTPPGGVKRTLITGDHINLDFDQDGYLIGIELLRGDLLHPSLREIASLPGSSLGEEHHEESSSTS